MGMGEKIRSALRVRNQMVREMMAEFIGTFILVTFAIASGMQYVLSKGTLSSPLTTNFAGGMGLTFGIYWSFGVSGASLNPAVTLALCLQGILPWWKYPFYAISEFAGAFVAAAIQFCVFYDGLNAYDGGVRSTYGETATAQIFSTFPNGDVSTANCLGDQVFGTFILISCILAVTDGKNMKPDKGLMPIALGAIVFAIGTCWAYNCGYAINPARDLGPRIFTAIAGWGKEPFSYRDYNWFWVPLVGPMIGAVVSWVLYNAFIQLHWPETRGEELGRVTGDEVVVSSNGGDATVATQRFGVQQNTGVDNPAYSSESCTIDMSGAVKTKM